MKKLYLVLAAVTLLVIAFLIGRFTATCNHNNIKIITSPKPGTPNQIEQKITGTAEGKIAERPWVWPDTPPSIPVGVDTAVTPKPESWSAEVPIRGNIEAKFIDKKTGKELATETKPLTGIASVTGDQSGLGVKTVFDTQLNFAVEVPELFKPWHFGGRIRYSLDKSLVTSLYGQYDYKLNNYLLTPIRVEFDGDWTVSAGLEINF